MADKVAIVYFMQLGLMKDRTDLGLLLLHALPLDSEMWVAQKSLLLNQTHAPNLYEFGNKIEVWAEKSLATTQNLTQSSVAIGLQTMSCRITNYL